MAQKQIQSSIFATQLLKPTLIRVDDRQSETNVAASPNNYC